VTVGIGGAGVAGAAGGASGNVSVTSTGEFIWTEKDHSYGILSQSIGGGGGDGGFSISAGFTTTKSNIPVTASFGGSGGGGGSAGSALVNNFSSIRTLGATAHGVLAQSIGGGGGSGGVAIALRGSTGPAGVIPAQAALAFGGSGGDGGDADTVTVSTLGEAIATAGDHASGILAQSVGGGGGDGGGAISATLGTQLSSVAFSMGGSGGGGGDSSDVTVASATEIGTVGNDSHGIFAQSVGGGGGSGGFSIAAAITGDAKALGVSIGGTGGQGGDGGAVTIDHTAGAIITSGDGSHAILGQSIGGGGGNGGFSLSGSLTTATGQAGASVSVGGSGAIGGFADRVAVANGGEVLTLGAGSLGIKAQSVGGGGGHGGFSFSGSFGAGDSKNVSFALGGGGAAGNRGGEVDAGNSGAIETFGIYSHGILAQSIGGGGGTGGFSASTAIGLGADNTNLNLGVAVGGAGGNGGFGNNVVVANSGTIATHGAMSHAVFSQSVGGGGGAGGSSFTGIIGLGGGGAGKNLNIGVAVGGGGGDGNHGGDVTTTNAAGGNIVTDGAGSHGIFSQSVGGGGGTGGRANALSLVLGTSCTTPVVCKGPDGAKNNWSLSVAVGGSGGGASNGGIVNVANGGRVVTRGIGSSGIFAQSIGGGGGNGGNGVRGTGELLPIPVETVAVPFSHAGFFKTWDVIVGGQGGSSGDGGAVNVTNSGNITTLGMARPVLQTDGSDAQQEASYGIFAQSVGGGGGMGGNAVVGLTGKVGIGGGVGSTGDGGAVSVSNTGHLTTLGAGGHAIVAQSVGGGGGMSGNVTRGPVLDFGVNLAIGQGGGNGGDGGLVTVSSASNIQTVGRNAFGIFAQSVGGGGGLAGGIGIGPQNALGFTSFAGSVGGAGSGGAVSVEHTGTIGTSGASSHGIFAQSAGGLGFGGAVSAELTGNIFATGQGSNGIVLQSRGDQGAGNLTAILDGMVLGGSAGGVGVALMDGASNLVMNSGSLGTVDGIAGTAVSGTGGSDTVVNLGNLTGSIDLGSGANALVNQSTGWFYAGATVNLGAGNFFTNSGDFSPGGSGLAQTTNLTGNFAQTGTPTWWVDIGEVGVSDSLLASGHGQLGSSVTTVNLNPTVVASGSGAYTLLAASRGLLGAQFQFGSYTGDMPLGRTFDFANTDRQVQLTLLPSTGDFFWGGARSDVWTSPFVDGVSNWTREDGSGVFGTPGTASTVIFSGAGDTTFLGADFEINGLVFTGSGAGGATAIAGGNTLTLAAADGRGITVERGAPGAALGIDLVLGNNQQWTNDSAGMLEIAGSTITGSGRRLTIAGPGDTTIHSAIQTGNGSLTKLGGGALFLRGANNYSGGTTVGGGRLVGDTFSLQGNILNNATLEFDQTFDDWYTGALTGAGTLIKEGRSALVMSGNSSGFTGNTIVQSGRLYVIGRLGGGSVLLHDGTLLGGTGVIPSLVVRSGATVAPGNSIGTLRATGDVQFEVGSFFEVQTITNGPSDEIRIDGSLTLSGGTVDVLAAGSGEYQAINRYTIATANGGVSGTFSGVTLDLGFMDPSLQYNPNQIFLTLRRNDIDFRTVGARGNAGAFAEMLNTLARTAEGVTADLVNTIYDLSDEQALNAIRSMTGVHYQHVARSSLDDGRVFLGVNMARLGRVGNVDGLSARSNGGSAFSPAGFNGGSFAFSSSGDNRGLETQTANAVGSDGRHGWWADGLGAAGDYSGNDVDFGATVRTQGLIGGFDSAVTRNLTLGVSAAWTSPRVDSEGANDRTTGRALHVGVYERYQRNASRLYGILAYRDDDRSTVREVTDGVNVLLSGTDVRGYGLATQAEYGYRFELGGGFGIEPAAGVQYIGYRANGAIETGAGALGLDVPNRQLYSLRSLAGTRVVKTIERQGRTRMIIEGRAAWAHEFNTLEDINLRLSSDIDTSGFTITSPDLLRNSGIFGGSVAGELGGGLRLSGDVSFEVSTPVKNVWGSFGVSKIW